MPVCSWSSSGELGVLVESTSGEGEQERERKVQAGRASVT